MDHFIGQAGNGWYYIVPESQREAWDAWAALSEEEAGEEPAYAHRLETAPKRMG